MKILWNEIRFVPTFFSLEEDEKTEDDIQQQSKDDQALSKASFKPSMKTQDPTSRDIELSDGIVIRNFPKALEEKDIHTFLSNHGLPFNHEDDLIKINKGERNTSVNIAGLSPQAIQAMLTSIHFHTTNQMFFDARLFCKPIRNMTPVKTTATPGKDIDKEAEKSLNLRVEEKNPQNLLSRDYLKEKD